MKKRFELALKPLLLIHCVELNLPAVGGFIWPIRREVSSCGIFN
jgi:hypothetical protein